MPAICTATDVSNLGVEQARLDRLGTTAVGAIISARISYANSRLARFYKLPISAWGSDLTLAVAQLAAWDVMARTGFNPDEPGGSLWRDRRDEGFMALEHFAKHGSPEIVDSTATAQESAPACYSEARRGW